MQSQKPQSGSKAQRLIGSLPQYWRSLLDRRKKIPTQPGRQCVAPKNRKTGTKRHECRSNARYLRLRQFLSVRLSRPSSSAKTTSRALGSVEVRDTPSNCAHQPSPYGKHSVEFGPLNLAVRRTRVYLINAHLLRSRGVRPRASDIGPCAMLIAIRLT